MFPSEGTRKRHGAELRGWCRLYKDSLLTFPLLTECSDTLHVSQPHNEPSSQLTAKGSNALALPGEAVMGSLTLLLEVPACRQASEATDRESFVDSNGRPGPMTCGDQRVLEIAITQQTPPDWGPVLLRAVGMQSRGELPTPLNSSRTSATPPPRSSAGRALESDRPRPNGS